MIIRPRGTALYLFFVRIECHAPSSKGTYKFNVNAVADLIPWAGDGDEAPGDLNDNEKTAKAKLTIRQPCHRHWPWPWCGWGWPW